jgi:hypothetical protein
MGYPEDPQIAINFGSNDRKMQPKDSPTIMTIMCESCDMNSTHWVTLHSWENRPSLQLFAEMVQLKGVNDDERH